MSVRLPYESYTVGWICALPLERAAAEQIFDDEHEAPPADENDPNIYTLGKIGDHNVVLACLPPGQIAIASAAIAANQMKLKFTAIRFGLMVGIGGGVPNSEKDIRLGDVVISQPSSTHGGVVQYDLGKKTPSGFERTGQLNAPPSVLLNALGKLQSNHLRDRNTISKHLASFNGFPKFTKPQSEDLLFQPSYNHNKSGTCNKKKVIIRPPRESDEIIIHYGTIASGSLVIKDALTRDKFSAELGGILCFEMEAAGLMNNFPCLIIRGICDYADTHKNKHWQNYSAAVAAATAKEILSVIPTAEIYRTRSIRETVLDRSLQPSRRSLGNSLELSNRPELCDEQLLKLPCSSPNRIYPYNYPWESSASTLCDELQTSRDFVRASQDPSPTNISSLSTPELNLPTISQAKALYDYVPKGMEELELRKGDIVNVLEPKYPNWWNGSLNGKTGMFPANYVEKVKTNGWKGRRLLAGDEEALVNFTKHTGLESMDSNKGMRRRSMIEPMPRSHPSSTTPTLNQPRVHSYSPYRSTSKRHGHQNELESHLVPANPLYLHPNIRLDSHQKSNHHAQYLSPPNPILSPRESTASGSRHTNNSNRRASMTSIPNRSSPLPTSIRPAYNFSTPEFGIGQNTKQRNSTLPLEPLDLPKQISPQAKNKFFRKISSPLSRSRDQKNFFDKDASGDYSISEHILKRIPLDNEDEFKCTRCSLVSHRASNFRQSDFTPRQKLFLTARKTELLIIMEYTNEDYQMFARTLADIIRNIDTVCSRNSGDRSPKYRGSRDRWKEIVIAVICDSHPPPIILDFLVDLGIYQRRQENPSPTKKNAQKTQIWEYTIQIKPCISTNGVIELKKSLPVQMIFVYPGPDCTDTSKNLTGALSVFLDRPFCISFKAGDNVKRDHVKKFLETNSRNGSSETPYTGT